MTNQPLSIVRLILFELIYNSLHVSYLNILRLYRNVQGVLCIYMHIPTNFELRVRACVMRVFLCMHVKVYVSDVRVYIHICTHTHTYICYKYIKYNNINN